MLGKAFKAFYLTARLNQNRLEARPPVKIICLNTRADDKVENVDELVLNKNQNGQKVTTTKGLSLETDLIIPCVGNKVQTEFLKSSLGKLKHYVLYATAERRITLKSIRLLSLLTLAY